MGWDEIKEIEKYDFVTIGNHSHSHDYLVNFSFDKFKEDINKSIAIFRSNLGYNPIFFSYPFGEWNSKQKEYISKYFDFAFGQHSGVIDLNKDKYELPRFPINEKYGNMERFSFLVKLLPLQYKKVYPEEKMLEINNPPKVKIEFFKDTIDISCQYFIIISACSGSYLSSRIKLSLTHLDVYFKIDKQFISVSL